MTVVLTHQDQTKSREFTNPAQPSRASAKPARPSGMDDVSGNSRSSTVTGNYTGGAGTCGVFTHHGFGLAQRRVPGHLRRHNTLINDNNYRSRASASYITGSHNVKVGWEGAYFIEKVAQRSQRSARLNYHYITPIMEPGDVELRDALRQLSARRPAFDPYSCGNTIASYYPEDPINRIDFGPVPVGVDVNTGVGETDERVWFGALYVQDQWTLKRLTFNGALRYDHAESRYGETCIGPDICVPMDADADGVPSRRTV